MNSDLIGCLNRRLMSVTEDLSKELNPSVYMALRLSSDHNLKKEAQYFHRLKNAFQAKEKRYVQCRSNPSSSIRTRSRSLLFFTISRNNSGVISHRPYSGHSPLSPSHLAQ